MMRVFLAIALLVLGTTSTVSAQNASFADHIRTASSLNQQLLEQIANAQSAADIGALNTRAGIALTTARGLELQLRGALALATSDEDRSRASGLLDHTLPVIADLQRAQQESSLNAGQGQLNQALGEANEALSEIPPTARPPQSAPSTLPETGNLGGPALATLPLFGGMFLVVVGILLRRHERVA
jgi:hypothetical protein